MALEWKEFGGAYFTRYILHHLIIKPRKDCVTISVGYGDNDKYYVVYVRNGEVIREGFVDNESGRCAIGLPLKPQSTKDLLRELERGEYPKELKELCLTVLPLEELLRKLPEHVQDNIFGSEVQPIKVEWEEEIPRHYFAKIKPWTILVYDKDKNEVWICALKEDSQWKESYELIVRNGVEIALESYSCNGKLYSPPQSLKRKITYALENLPERIREKVRILLPNSEKQIN